MDRISEIIQGKHTAVIAGHERPDGDCIGSCLGLYLYLKQIRPDMELHLCLQEVPPVYRFLPGIEEAELTAPKMKEPDVFFALDCGDENRIAAAGDLFAQAKERVVVDHHISNQGYGDRNIIFPHASSTSEIVYELLTADGAEITNEIAQGIYLGIVQDTGVFQYSCTGKRTMEIAGELMACGIDFSRIVEETFFQKTYLQNRILGKALTDSKLLLDGKMIVSVLTGETIRSFGAELSDLEGIVSQLRNTTGVEVSAFVYETGEEEYKVSLRSKNTVDVSKIAAACGGGGHVRAAACRITGRRPEEFLPEITAMAESQLKEAND